MSAAVAHVAALAALSPAPLVQPSSLALRKLKFSVAGDLLKHAEVRTAVDGSVHLVVQVLQPGGGLPFVAMFHAPAEQAENVHLHAATLHKGLTALVVGVGIRVSTFDGHQVLTGDHIVSVNQLVASDFLNDLDRFEVRS